MGSVSIQRKFSRVTDSMAFQFWRLRLQVFRSFFRKAPACIYFGVLSEKFTYLTITTTVSIMKNTLEIDITQVFLSSAHER